MNVDPTPVAGIDNSLRLLHRNGKSRYSDLGLSSDIIDLTSCSPSFRFEGVISEIPNSLCEKYRTTADGQPAKQGKNVILVIG
jgi:hypothetical protein